MMPGDFLQHLTKFNLQFIVLFILFMQNVCLLYNRMCDLQQAMYDLMVLSLYLGIYISTNA